MFVIVSKYISYSLGDISLPVSQSFLNYQMEISDQNINRRSTNSRFNLSTQHIRIFKLNKMKLNTYIAVLYNQ